MGFYKNTKIPSKTGAISFDAEMAHKLYNALKAKRKLPPGRASSIKTWSNEFKILRLHLKDKDRIRTVLDWYTIHIGEEFVPFIQSAKKFRFEFDRIVLAMERSNPLHVSVPKVLITHEAERILDRFKDLNWPQLESSQVPVFIQLSLDNMNQFRTALRTLYCKLKLEADQIQNEQRRKGKAISYATTRDQRLAAHLIGSLAGPDMLIRDWIERIHRYAWNMPEWGGNLIRYVWKADSKLVHKLMMQFTAEYMGDGKHWLPIWEKLQPFLKKDT